MKIIHSGFVVTEDNWRENIFIFIFFYLAKIFYFKIKFAVCAKIKIIKKKKAKYE